MAIRALTSAVLAAGLMVAAPALAQTSADGGGLPMVGPGSKAYKPQSSATVGQASQQPTDGGSLPMVGPGSKADKQRTDGGGLTMVGPGSKAYKQQTDGGSLPMVGPGSTARQ
jgi:hypothetical protein